MTAKDKKELFLQNYSKSFHRGNSMKGVMTWNTFYTYLEKDEDFKKAVDEIEMSIVFKAEQKYSDLLESDDQNVVFKVAREILSSKLGKKHSQLTKDDNNQIKIKGDKTITFKFGNDSDIEE